eukprot:13312056-Alexandrium_andersonii.AAC.1
MGQGHRRQATSSTGRRPSRHAPAAPAGPLGPNAPGKQRRGRGNTNLATSMLVLIATRERDPALRWRT